MAIAIRVENLWKKYRLGVIGYGTLQRDLQSWWARVRGKEDPNAPVDILSDSDRIHGDTITALQDVSFDVDHGEILGIIGGNGAGKTTMLQIITGLTAPTTGQIKLKGRVGALLAVGTGMHPELTGRENIFLNGAILGMTKAETARKFDQIVDFSGMERFIDTPVKRYSSGMNVRLGFAVAAHLEPEILLVDEVLSVGDAVFQKKCIGKIDSVAREGRTVVFVSHNMLAVQNLCSRAIQLDGGKLVFDGTPEAAIERYLSSLNDDESYTVDLTSTPNRSEDSRCIFQSLELFVKGKPANTVPMGEELEFKLSYNTGVKVSKPVIRVFLEDGYGRRIAEFNPSLTNPGMIQNPPVSGVLNCRVSRLNLMPGRYYLSLLEHDELGQRDRIDRACVLDVKASNVFGTSKLPKTGTIFLGSEWGIEGRD